MDKSLVAGLVELFDRSSLTELEYEGDGFRLRLARNGAAQGPATARAGEAPDAARRDAVAAAAPPPAAAASRPMHKVIAGVAGTFFRRPAPDQPPHVEPGDVVSEGQPLGVVEAMKMLNAVEADCSGTIVSIDVEDGAMVSAGDVLMTMAPEGS